jgi:tight adherence protein B
VGYGRRRFLKTKKSYDRYVFTWKDWLELLGRISLKAVLICYLFYDSVKAVLLIVPFAWLDYKSMKEDKTEQQKRRLTNQFKAMIESLVTSLNAGYSLEHAFGDAKRDLLLVYEPQEIIFSELDMILEGLKVNVTLEDLLKDFGRRSGVEDIRNFANVVAAAKKSGGNLIRIIEKTVHSISDKLAVEEEIKTMIAAKRLEERIMMIMPYGIILYLRLTNGDFLEVLYHNVLGGALMTLFLIVIHLADMWAKKVMEIRV